MELLSGLYRFDCKQVVVIEFHSWLTKIAAYGINILCMTSQQAGPIFLMSM